MMEKEPWWQNDLEGKTLRKIIELLNSEFHSEDMTLNDAMNLAKTIAYVAGQKNTLAKANKEIEDRLERLEQLAGLVKYSPPPR